jgi:acyl-coenzyme A thioesterase PaaI-like protein
MTEPLSQSQLDAFSERWNRNGVLRYLGIRIGFRANERVIVELPKVIDVQRGGKGSDAVNGGVLAMMFDFALGATALLAPPLRRNATAQLSLNFQKAVRGNSARCVAKLDRGTRSLLFSSADLFDERGEICARATALVSVGQAITLDEWATTLAPYDDQP